MAGFQRIGDRFTLAPFGGSTLFGTTPFGGGSYAPEAFEFHLPSDDVTQDFRRRRAEIVHRRLGAVVGFRKYTSVRVWNCSHRAITEETLTELLEFYNDGKFYLLQDGDEAGRRVEVYWSGGFEPVNRRGGFYDIDYTIEEVV